MSSPERRRRWSEGRQLRRAMFFSRLSKKSAFWSRKFGAFRVILRPRERKSVRMNLFNTSLKAAVLGCCAFLFGLQSWGQYDLTIEQSAPAAAPGMTYRFYVEANDASDKISAVFGNDESPLVISCPDGIFNSPMNASWNASGVNPAFFAFFADLQDDSYATIGLEGPAGPGAEDPSLVQDATLNPTVSGFFTTPGSTELNVNTLTGGSWYVLNTAANALPDATVVGWWLKSHPPALLQVCSTIKSSRLAKVPTRFKRPWNSWTAKLLCLVMASWTSAVFATVLASQRALATATAQCLLVVTIVTEFASSMKTTTAFAIVKTNAFQALL